MTGYGMTICPVRAFRLVATAILPSCSIELHTVNIRGPRDGPLHQSHHKQKGLIKKDDNDDPADDECLDSDIKKAGFTVFSKPGLFLLFRYYVGCRSPPLVLHFTDFLNSKKWRTSKVDKNKRAEYLKKYPGVSDEIINFLVESDKKMKYQEYDRKMDHDSSNEKEKAVKRLPAIERSFERLLEEDKQFQMVSESPEDIVEKKMLIERMMAYVEELPSDEKNLIYELYFSEKEGKSVRQLSKETGIPLMTISYRKKKILEKLEKLLEK
jgi:RNA polymerase sigma factor (sigma-70 family)